MFIICNHLLYYLFFLLFVTHFYCIFIFIFFKIILLHLPTLIFYFLTTFDSFFFIFFIFYFIHLTLNPNDVTSSVARGEIINRAAIKMVVSFGCEEWHPHSHLSITATLTNRIRIQKRGDIFHLCPVMLHEKQVENRSRFQRKRVSRTNCGTFSSFLSLLLLLIKSVSCTLVSKSACVVSKPRSKP